MTKVQVWKEKMTYWEEQMRVATTEARQKHCAKQIARLKKKLINPQAYSGY